MTDKQKLEAREKQYELDIQSVMKMESGRRVMYAILERAGMFRSSVISAGFRTNETFFVEGGRNEALKLMGDLQTHAPILYGKMLEEARNDDGS